MTNVIDEEECKMINDLKEEKEIYVSCSEKFKNAKAEISNLKNNLDLLRLKYVESFENWFYKKYGIKVEEHELKLSKVNYIFNIE